LYDNDRLTDDYIISSQCMRLTDGQTDLGSKARSSIKLDAR